jgi:hypothetical protein
MAVDTPTKPVADTVRKVDDEIAVGSDLQFQRRWWIFERCIWTIFTILIVVALLGGLGRGFLARAQYRMQDGSVDIRYERIARFGTPSVLMATFGPDVVHDGRVRFWVSDDLVKRLGNQRVIPQPAESILSDGGIEYTFPAAAPPLTIQFSLEPTAPGRDRLTFRIPGRQPIQLGIFVLP